MAGYPFLVVKELGGTGRVHDWNLSRKIVELSPVPVFLAGGLHAGNVRDAIDSTNHPPTLVDMVCLSLVGQVQPFGVDLCNGVRTNGRLDEKKLAAFFNALLV